MNAGRTVLAILLLAVAARAGAQVPPAVELNIVPRPAKIKMLPGVFRLTDATRIVAADEESRRIAGLFNDFLLEQHGLRLEISSVRPRTANYLALSRAGGGDSGPEGYHLVIGTEGIRVTGTAAGLFYGMKKPCA